MAQYTDDEIAAIYDDLTSDLPAKPERNPRPQKWSAADFTTATGYVKRVAKTHTLDEFKEFIRTGQPVHPVKMTPAEMEVLMGGTPFHEWAGTVGTGFAAVAVAVAVAMCT